MKSTASQNDVELIQDNVPNSRWFLSNLQVYYEGMLEVHCRHRRYGTILFHKNCDLINALSIALGKQQRPKSNPQQADIHDSEPTCIKNSVTTVAKYLNGILHERARTVCVEYNGIPEKVCNFNLCELVAKTNPILREFLRELTQSVRQSKRKLFEEPSPEVDTKSIRLAFALSVLQFSTTFQVYT